MYETWPCPACARPVRLDRSGALREHTVLEGADPVWKCVGTGYSIFEESKPQLTARGLRTYGKKGV